MVEGVDGEGDYMGAVEGACVAGGELFEGFLWCFVLVIDSLG